MAPADLRAQAIEAFSTAYAGVLQDPNDISDTLQGLEDLLSDNVTLTYAGKPGATPFFGQFIGKQGVSTALTGITGTTNTTRFTTEELIASSYKVDFSLLPNPPLVEQSNRAAIIFEQEDKVIDTGLKYRLDSVALLTIEDDGKISGINFFYDPYVPSQAFMGSQTQITNPDIDPVLNPKRATAANEQDTIGAVLNFFGTFGSITDNNFDRLLPTLSSDAVVSFAGDPSILPFADDKIREGASEVSRTLNQIFTNAAARSFTMQEWFVKGDRVIANTFEERTALSTGRGYALQLEIMLTAKDGLVNSLQSIFDSSITSTAFTGNDPFPISASGASTLGPVRSQAEAEFINLTGYDSNTTPKVRAQLDIFSDAVYNNTIGIFVVDDVTGSIEGVKPGDSGYLTQALNRTVLSFNRGFAKDRSQPHRTDQSLSATLDAGTILAAFVITNGTRDTLLAQNPSNARSATNLNAYFTFQAANPDNGFDHFRISGNRFQVEDLWGGGDADFNDMSFAVTVSPLT